MIENNTLKTGENQGPLLILTINGDSFNWNKQYITGSQIRNLGKIPEEHILYLSINKPWDDELISNDTVVDLARPTIEHFFSKEKHKNFKIIVNGREKIWERDQISFEELVVLAFGSFDNNPDRVYTVTYDKGPKENPEGSLVKGDVVFIKAKMIFNVSATNKS